MICPVYENPEEEELSPFDLPNTKPFTWSWLSTLNRSNTQVRKVSSQGSVTPEEINTKLNVFQYYFILIIVSHDRICDDPVEQTRIAIENRFTRSIWRVHDSRSDCEEICSRTNEGLTSAPSPFSNLWANYLSLFVTPPLIMLL